MPIPRFNQYGLLPQGIYEASMEDVVRGLGFTPRRQELIGTGLQFVCGELGAAGVTDVVLDGSFVTWKPSPGDIDAYVVTKLGSAVASVIKDRRRLWFARYQVDLFAAFEDLTGPGSVAYWEEFFGHTREQPPQAKGLIKLNLGRR